MPLPRFAKLEPSRQEALLASAAEEFAARGYEAASLNRILLASGVSKGALYYYFADKADLYATVVERAIDGWLRTLGPLLEPRDVESFWARIQDAVVRSATVFAGDPQLAALARSCYAALGPPGAGGPADPLLARWKRWIEAELARGRALGAVRDDLPESLLAEMLLGLCTHADRWALERWESLTPESLTRLCSELVDVCRRVCARPEEGLRA